MSFKKGDIGIVVGNRTDHEFPIGTKVRYVGDSAWEYIDGSDYWYINEIDVNLDTVESVMDEVISASDYNEISKPQHYNHGDGVECIEYIKQVLGPEGFIAYCRGNLMKYNHRAMYKGSPSKDLAKAEQYLKWVNETLEDLNNE